MYIPLKYDSPFSSAAVTGSEAVSSGTTDVSFIEKDFFINSVTTEEITETGINGSADIFANNKSPVLRDIVGFSNGTGNEKQFKRVLDSLTPEKIQQIVKETNGIYNGDYVDNYINQFKE